MSRHVLVLMGGWSAEREVSLASGRGSATALRNAGFEVTEYDLTTDIAALLRALDPAPDVVFNALHGPFGEDGRIQGLLDMLTIPYTHSGATASAIAMDKSASRPIFVHAGLPVAEGRVYQTASLADMPEPARPYVVKPLNEGSSVGVEILFADDEKDWAAVCAGHATYSRVLIEHYVPGREIQVAVKGQHALGAIEIRTTRRFYDYEAKYAAGGSEHLMPAPIHPAAYETALDLSVRAHRALGCRGVSRVDLRYDDTAGEPGRFVVLEVNTQPGMTPTSLVPEIAAHADLSFEQLVTWMVEEARCDG